MQVFCLKIENTFLFVFARREGPSLFALEVEAMQGRFYFLATKGNIF